MVKKADPSLTLGMTRVRWLSLSKPPGPQGAHKGRPYDNAFSAVR